MPAVEFKGDTELRGEQLIGREILIRWEVGLWYDAIIVQYYEDEDEHKIVYRFDDGIEITRLTNRRWTLLAKKSSADYQKPILDGAIVRFLYPKDGKVYKGMIYDYNSTGTIIKIAYLTEHSTDVLKGPEWDFLRRSPCSLDEDNPGPAIAAARSSGSTEVPESPPRPSRSRRQQRRGTQQPVSSGRVRKRRLSSRRTSS